MVRNLTKIDKKIEILISIFKIKSSPPEGQFDLKQTRFKKISVFLKEMESKGSIKIKDQKGVLSITEINKENDLCEFFLLRLKSIKESSFIICEG